MYTSFLRKLAQTAYVRKAIADRADLGVFKERPTPRVIFGLCVIGFSYVIGWPVITGLGILSVYLKKPMLLAVGGPVMYGISHLTFMVGAYFSGAVYAREVMRWSTRVGMERLLGSTHLDALEQAKGEENVNNLTDRRLR